MKRHPLICLVYLFAAGALFATRTAPAVDIPPLDQRAAWFREARFGLFIHWGVYSIVGKGEWLQETAKIPTKEYEKLYPQFNPALAKRAGQRYLVITTKHHDGFCMFDSKLTDYDIMSTPLRRDVIKELADECHKQGIRLGFYYSIMDWHHPDYLPRRSWEKGRTAEGADFDRYVQYMRGQIRELLSNYGQVDILWFDGGWERTKPEDTKKFQAIIDMARKLQPQMLVNNRANIGGDFDTPEQFVPASGLTNAQGKPMLWEACMTMTTGHGAFAPTAWWGYDRYETVFKPADELIQKLVDIASKGGNFLLNIGPEPTGKIRPQEAERLEAVGRWMARHHETIHGTTASPFRMLPFFGRVTRKGDRLFVHVFDWPSDRRLRLPGLNTPVEKAAMLGTGAAVPIESRQGEFGPEALLRLPDQPTDPVASVVEVQLKGAPVVEPLVIRPDAKGVVRLPAEFAEIHAEHGQRAKPVSQKGQTYIGNWSNPNDVVVWGFTLPAAGSYAVAVQGRPASPQAIGQRVRVSVGKQQLTGKIASAGVTISGQLNIPAGPQTISVALPDANRTGPPVFDLYGGTLKPAQH